MADLIDRPALLEKRVPKEKTSDLVCQMIPLKDVLEAPAVDAVELVRCEACKSFGLHSHKRYGFCSHPNGLMSPKPDQFCSYGERRTDATD